MTHPGSAWLGHLRVGLGWGVFAGHAGDGDAHAHHAVQVLMSEVPQRVWTRAGGVKSFHGLVIGADVEHRVEPTSAPVTLLYVESDSVAGRRLQQTLSQGVREIESECIQAVLKALGNDPTTATIEAAIALLTQGDSAPMPPLGSDPLIEQLIEGLPLVLPSRLPATRLARQAGLSESRFLHRFREHVGMPLRPYLRWRRLIAAIQQVLAGESLTDAAMTAGFADAAHFTRTFRRHFGIAPRTLSGFLRPQPR